MTRAELLSEVQSYFVDQFIGNVSAEGTADRLVDLINSAYIPETDGPPGNTSWNNITGDPSDNSDLTDYIESFAYLTEILADNIYDRLDGLHAWTGDHDGGGNNLENIDEFLVASVQTTGLIHIGDTVNIQPLSKQSMEIIPDAGDASLLFSRPTVSDIASFDFITGTNTNTGWSFEFKDSDGKFRLLDRVNNRTHAMFTNDGVSDFKGDIVVDGFIYYDGADPASPITGDLREGKIGSDLVLQEYDNPAYPAIWSARSSR